jgi:hypothetical protein
MGFGVLGVFSVGLDDKISHSFGFKIYASLRSAHIKFFKRKKEKKESHLFSGSFKKVKFFYKKILPDSTLESEA